MFEILYPEDGEEDCLSESTRLDTIQDVLGEEGFTLKFSKRIQVVIAEVDCEEPKVIVEALGKYVV